MQNALIKITYTCRLPLFGNRFGSSEALFHFCTSLGYSVPFLLIPCEQGFLRIRSLVLNECWRNGSSSFLLWLLTGVLLDFLFSSSFTTAFRCWWVWWLAAGWFPCSLLASPSIASAPPSCTVGCPGAVSLCSTSFFPEGASASWCSSKVVLGRSHYSLFLLCFVAGCCSSSPNLYDQPSWKICLLLHLLN